MNCKPGDMAVIVRSVMGNEGKIVRCLRLSPHHVWVGPGGEKNEPGWEIDRVLVGFGGDCGPFVADSLLRPIRDPGDDATDESTAWLPPVPTQQTEAV